MKVWVTYSEMDSSLVTTVKTSDIDLIYSKADFGSLSYFIRVKGYQPDRISKETYERIIAQLNEEII